MMAMMMMMLSQILTHLAAYAMPGDEELQDCSCCKDSEARKNYQDHLDCNCRENQNPPFSIPQLLLLPSERTRRVKDLVLPQHDLQYYSQLGVLVCCQEAM